MQFSTALIALIASSPFLLTQVSAQRLQKNVIGGPHTDRFLSQIWDTMKPPTSSHTTWRDGHIPSACKSEADRTGCPATQVKAYSVTYSDCTQPWTVCRCGDPKTSLAAQLDLFARLPVKARVHVRHLMNFPEWKGKQGVAAYAIGPDFALTSDVGRNFAIMVHEVTHVLDKGKSASAEFKAAFDADSCVLSDYALTGMAENFAVIAPLVMIETMNPGGWPKIKADLKMDCMKNQYEFVRRAFLEMFKPGGDCPARVEKDSPVIVVKGNGQSRRGLFVPDVDEVQFEPIVEEHEGAFLSRRELEELEDGEKLYVESVDEFDEEAVDAEEEEEEEVVEVDEPEWVAVA